MPLKRSIRALLDRAAAATGALSRRESSLHGQLTILMYHRVLPDVLWKASPLPGLVMPVSCFTAQMKYLSEHFEVVTLAQGLQRLMANSHGSKPLLSITFDDGYDDNHSHATPILESLGLRATFFLVSGFVGTNIELWFDQAARWFHGALPGDLVALVDAVGITPSWARGDKPIVRTFMASLKSLTRAQRLAALSHILAHPTARARRECDLAMSIADAQDLLARGHEIGAHTVTHPLLTQEVDASLRAEISGARETISSWLQSPVAGFCYPNGDVDDRVANAVRDAGYSYAPTVAPGFNRASIDPFHLKRLDMNSARVLHEGRHDEAMFRAELALMHPY